MRDHITYAVAVAPSSVVRVQVTLFVPEPAASLIERVRRVVDPVQFGLIPAHVTLCREHELEGISVALLRQRLEGAGASPLCLTFGAPRPFVGHGMLLPCVGGTDAFQRLRTVVLDNRSVALHEAHLTLAHPRNPRAAGNEPVAYESLPPQLDVAFAAVALITQRDGQAWVVDATIPLHGSHTPA